MRTIILTGYDSRQFEEIVEKKGDAGCYLCKRREGIFLVKDKDGEGQGTRELEFEWVSRISDNEEHIWPLCQECSEFLEAFIERLIFKKEFGKQLDLEEGGE